MAAVALAKGPSDAAAKPELVINQTLLPRQELNRFNEAIRELDRQNFAKSFIYLDAVLKKFPNCTDALAVRGLAVHGVQQLERNSRDDKKRPQGLIDIGTPEEVQSLLAEDPYAICKSAIQKDFKNVLAWHAMGNLYRQDKNYPEALKALKQANKVEQLPANYTPNTTKSPFSLNLHRDLFNLAVQQRDWEVAIETRQRAVNFKSAMRVHWNAYALSEYMAGNIELACGISDTMCKIMEPGDSPAEINEILLLRADMHMQVGHYKQAIQILQGQEPNMPTGACQTITDRPEKQRLLAKCYVATRAKDKAKKTLESLLEMRQMERDAILMYAEAEGIKLESIDDVEGGGFPREVKSSPEFVKILDELAVRFPKCDSAKRLALDYCDASTPEGAADFVRRLKAYIVPFVRNLVPSLVTVLESLYVYKTTKVPLIEQTFMSWKESLEKGEGHAEFEASSSSSSGKSAESTSPKKNPTYILAIFEFLSAHFAKKFDFVKAHEMIDKAIAHTPTHEVLYLSKARIFNLEGKRQEAAEFADTAQRLDKQDKYLNNKSASYFLRAGDVETAEARLALFFKPSTVKDAHLQSFELQYTWYERELGCAYLYQKKDYFAALQALLLIEKHQEDNHDELVDFHGYTLRRNNCRQWLDVLKTEDAFNGTNHFLQSCPHIIRAYLGVAELGSAEAVMKQHVPREPLGQHEDENEYRRIVKMEKEFMTAPDLTNPLDKALKYVAALQQYKSNGIETHELAFEVAIAAERPVAAASAIAQLHRIVTKENRAGSKPEEVSKLIKTLSSRLEDFTKKNSAKLNAVVVELVNSTLAKCK